MKLRKLFAPLLALAMLASCAGPKMTWDDCIKDGEKLAANGWTTYEVDIDGMAKEYMDACKKELGKEYEISIVNALFYTNSNYDMCAFFYSRMLITKFVYAYYFRKRKLWLIQDSGIPLWGTHLFLLH